MNKKQMLLIIMIVFSLYFVTGCSKVKCPECKERIEKDLEFCTECNTRLKECSHEWVGATCIESKTCSKCHETSGGALGHDWSNATCITPKTCKVCNLTEGNSLGHIYDDDCDIKCNRCSKERDINHTWTNATCITPKTCNLCGLIEGEALGHTYDNDCDTDCNICRETRTTYHVDNDNDYFCDICNICVGIDKYMPKWNPNNNTNNWNGNGMIIKIVVNSKSNYDPFDDNYPYDDKKILQKQIRLIEAIYGIDLVFEDYPDAAPWGPNRVEYIKAKVISGDFKEEDTHIVNIDSTWITALTKAGCLASLATVDEDFKTVSGIFTEVGFVYDEETRSYVEGTYQQDVLKNQVTTILNNVYGYIPGKVRPDYYMYYNADMINEAGMTDPAELWLRGEWTWDKFLEYSEELQTNLDENEYALSLQFADLIVGSVNSTGSFIANFDELRFTSDEVVNKLKDVQNLYSNEIYERRNVEDVSSGFLEKRVAIVSGKLWFINNETRFDHDICDFTIGAVPYPTEEGEGGIPILTTNISDAILGYDGNPIEYSSGEYISGVDMSESSYRIPYTTSECFSVIDQEDSNMNKILFSILYDLYDGLGANPESLEETDDEKYCNSLETKFDKELYIDVIMSVQNKISIEFIETLNIANANWGWGNVSIYPLYASICKNVTYNPYTELKYCLNHYENAMKSMGYRDFIVIE